MSDWRDRAKDRAKEKAQGANIKLAEGPNCLRVLPDKKDITADGKLNVKGVQHDPQREFRTHRDVGPDKEFNIACGKDIDGKGDCWLCDVMIPKLEAVQNTAKRQQAQSLHAQEQLVVNASRFDPDLKKFSASKPWYVSTGSGIPGRQGQSLATRVMSKIAKLGTQKDYVDPNKGYNMNVLRVGSGIKTRYPEVEGDETPSKVPPEVLLTVKDLDSIIPVYDSEVQQNAFYGKPHEDSEERPERTERPKTARRSVPVEEEEVVESEEEFEEPEAEAEEPEADVEEPLDEDVEELEDPDLVEPEPDEEEEEAPPPPPRRPVPVPAKKTVPTPKRR